MSSEFRWRVGLVVHIYNSADLPSDATTATTTSAIGSLPTLKILHSSSSHMICCKYPRHTLALIAPLQPPPPPLWEYVYAYINPLLLSR